MFEEISILLLSIALLVMPISLVLYFLSRELEPIKSRSPYWSLITGFGCIVACCFLLPNHITNAGYPCVFVAMGGFIYLGLIAVPYIIRSYRISIVCQFQQRLLNHHSLGDEKDWEWFRNRLNKKKAAMAGFCLMYVHVIFLIVALLSSKRYSSLDIKYYNLPPSQSCISRNVYILGLILCAFYVVSALFLYFQIRHAKDSFNINSELRTCLLFWGFTMFIWFIMMASSINAKTTKHDTSNSPGPVWVIILGMAYPNFFITIIYPLWLSRKKYYRAKLQDLITRTTHGASAAAAFSAASSSDSSTMNSKASELSIESDSIDDEVGETAKSPKSPKSGDSSSNTYNTNNNNNNNNGGNLKSPKSLNQTPPHSPRSPSSSDDTVNTEKEKERAEKAEKAERERAEKLERSEKEKAEKAERRAARQKEKEERKQSKHKRTEMKSLHANNYNENRKIKSVAELLENQAARKLFRQFLSLELSGENLIFYDVIQDYKSTYDNNTLETKIKKANSIYMNFIDPKTAISEVNLPYTVVSSLTKNLDKFNKKQDKDESLWTPLKELFDDAEKETMMLMTDSFMRFIQTQDWKEFQGISTKKNQAIVTN